MQPALENLCGPGKPLKAEAPDANEIAGLLRTGIARLGEPLEEELRLLYVGMTRATEKLVLTAAGSSLVVDRVKNSLEVVAAQFEEAL